MLDRERSPNRWIDFIWLVFLGGLALLPPVAEIHKQLIILAIVVFQFFEGLADPPHCRSAAAYYVVAIKILLATLLLDHTGGTGINSTYYPIFFLPVVSAAIYFGPVATLAWTTVASLAYLSLLYGALEEYELTSEGVAILTIRVLFFLYRRYSWSIGSPWKIAARSRVCRFFRKTGRNQPPIAPRRSRCPPRRTSRGAGTTLRRARARNPQSAGRDQRLGGNAEPGRSWTRSRWWRNWPATFRPK